MSLLKSKFVLILFYALLIACSNKPSKIYLSTLQEIGWNDDAGSNDSLFVLFTSVNQCSPCEQEIQEWNKKYGESKKVLLIIKEKYTSNFDNYISTNSIVLNSLQDKNGLFRDKDLIPFLPYKILIIKDKVKDLGELGKN